MKRPRFHASLERMEPRQLLTTFVVNTTADYAGPATDPVTNTPLISLRYAITLSNESTTPGSNNIDFAIPAAVSVNPNLTQPHDVAFPGFDPSTKEWTIGLTSPLPALTHQVTIDGYTEGETGIPFNYPAQSQYQTLSISGAPTGGTFTLTTSAPLPVGTVTLPYDATASQVQAALTTIVGTAPSGSASPNVIVTGSTNLPFGTYNIYFRGIYDGLNIQPLTVTNFLVGSGTSAPTVTVTEVQPLPPTEITSAPSTVAAKDGNDATPRIIVEGGGTSGGSGFNIESSDTNLRGLIIDGFDIGVSVAAGAVGDVIQGNDIGQYPVSLVDPTTGIALTGSGAEAIEGLGNSAQGVLLQSTNATVGGVETQDANVIIGNGAEGVSVLLGAHGNQILGNQIGIVGPGSTGTLYAIVPNRSDGVRIADSSNYVGGSVGGAGNIISGNVGDGVHIVGSVATRNDVEGNYIGAGPGGGFLLGSFNPGNQGNGVTIEDAASNQIGGPPPTGSSVSAAQNVISSNSGAGVQIFDHTGGNTAVNNLIQGNIIGLTADALSVLGNAKQGVLIESANNSVNNTNIISANLQGVLLSGTGAIGNLVNGNFIGTNGDFNGDKQAGTSKLGNAEEGVRIDNGASFNTISGNAKGSQLISGNNVGLLITGNTTTGNLVFGNFIGTDITGTQDLGNSNDGVEINNSSSNTIGGATATALNLISANHTAIEIVGAQAINNLVQGNFVGTDITGTLPVGNEIYGVYIHQGASFNTIGGTASGAGNTIGLNELDGVRIEDNSVSNPILGNSIFANAQIRGQSLGPVGALGIAIPNTSVNAPNISSVATSITSTIINGTLTGTPNSSYTIQFFGSTPQDMTQPFLAGVGEGGLYLGQVTAVTGPNGIATYSANLPSLLKSGQYVTATATDSAGNTSEFSTPVNQIFGTVGFQMTSYTVNEGVGTATIVVTRTGGSGGYFTVDYSTSDGSAIAGTDYQAAKGTLTFNPGVGSQSFTVTIDDNGLPSADKTLFVNLSNPQGPITLGSQSSVPLNILGNEPGAIEFQMANYVVDEAAGTATITVTRQTPGTTTSVNYATGGGTAIPGVDYAPTSGTLTFTPSQVSQTFTVPILINPAITGNVSLFLTLSSPTNGSTIGNPSAAQLVIQPALIQFPVTSYTVDQAAGTAIVTVSRSSTVGTSTVNYSTANGTAIAGVDYTPTAGTLTFVPGQSVASFTVPILIDPLIKGNLALNLSLSSPAGGAILGSPSTASLIILDDGVDRQGPHATSVTAISGPRGVAELVVTFDEALNPTTAVNLLNYGFSVRTPGRDGKLGTKDDHLIGIRNPSYNATTFTVTLPLATAVSAGMPLELMLNAATDVPSAGIGISDLLGNLLDGNNDGYPGGSFTAKVVAHPAPPPVHPTVAAKGGSHKVKTASHKVTISSVKSHPAGPKTHATTPTRHG